MGHDGIFGWRAAAVRAESSNELFIFFEERVYMIVCIKVSNRCVGVLCDRWWDLGNYRTGVLSLLDLGWGEGGIFGSVYYGEW